MDRKKQIIKTAERMFSQRGIGPTRMIDIANELNISKKTIYQTFRSKEELVNIVYVSKLEELGEEVEKVVNGDKPFYDKLIDYIILIDDALINSSPTIMDEIKKGYPTLTEKVNSYVQNAVFNRFKTLMRSGYDSDMLGKNVTIDSVLFLYRDAISNYLTNQYTRNIPQDFDHSVDKSKSIFCENLITLFRGILNEKTLTEFNRSLKVNSSLKHHKVV